MPRIHKSTIRRARQAERRHERNRATVNTVRTLIKKVHSSAIGKAVSKGILHRNTASRRISRLAHRVNAMSGSGS
jgi:small subunit ribosomal protein S20